MRRAALLGLVVAGAAVVSWALARDRGGTTPETPVPAVEPAEPAEPRLAATTAPSEATATEPTPPPKTDLLGTVVDAKGVPVARVHITARTDLEPARPGRMLSDPKGIAITDAEGKFTVRGLAAGTYVLEARGDGIPPTAVFATAGGSPVKLHLLTPPRGEAIEVRILDADGEAIRGAFVSAGTVSGVTDREGRVRLTPVEPGRRTTLHVKPPKERIDLHVLTRADWVARDEAMRLERAFVIRGRVVDKDGKPVARALVFGPTPPGGWEYDSLSLDTTDAQGRFVLARLRTADPRRLHARPSWVPDIAANSEEVEAGVTEEATIRLDLGVDLEVKVVPAAPGHRVLATREAEIAAPSEERTGRDGVARLRSLRRDATYALFVVAEYRGAPSAWLRGVRPTEGPIVLPLRPSKAIEGSIVCDKPFHHAQVSAYAMGVSVKGEVAEDGTFRIEGLPEGRFQVTAHADGDAPLEQYFCRGAADAQSGASVEVTMKAIVLRGH